jgi:hypothetical protein
VFFRSVIVVFDVGNQTAWFAGVYGEGSWEALSRGPRQGDQFF